MNWLSDPGHAWLKVRSIDLINSGVADKISGYSYVRGAYVYLEEDCDAEKYLAAINYPVGKEIRDCHTNRHSRVRSYRSYSVERLYKQLEIATEIKEYKHG